MNKITYLGHSSFVIDNDKAVLIFDYIRDSSHTLHRILEHNTGKPVIFFSTGHSPDHYDKTIFEIAQNHSRTYVLSNDIPAASVPDTIAAQYMGAGDYSEGLPGGICVKACPSTGDGISYLVVAGNKTIFHAGSLNDWHWQDKATFKEVEAAEERFKKAVNQIAAETPTIDIAFFPVDTRLGSDMARGARIFLREIQVSDFIPMHFNGDYLIACNFADYAPDTTKCHCLHVPGESIELS